MGVHVWALTNFKSHFYDVSTRLPSVSLLGLLIWKQLCQSKVVCVCLMIDTEKNCEMDSVTFLFIINSLSCCPLCDLKQKWHSDRHPRDKIQRMHSVTNLKTGKSLPNFPCMRTVRSGAICRSKSLCGSGIREWMTLVPVCNVVSVIWCCKVGPMKSKLVIRFLG